MTGQFRAKMLYFKEYYDFIDKNHSDDEDSIKVFIGDDLHFYNFFNQDYDKQIWFLEQLLKLTKWQKLESETYDELYPNTRDACI